MPVSRGPVGRRVSCPSERPRAWDTTPPLEALGSLRAKVRGDQLGGAFSARSWPPWCPGGAPVGAWRSPSPGGCPSGRNPPSGRGVLAPPGEAASLETTAPPRLEHDSPPIGTVGLRCPSRGGQLGGAFSARSKCPSRLGRPVGVFCGVLVVPSGTLQEKFSTVPPHGTLGWPLGWYLGGQQIPSLGQEGVR